MLLRVYWDKYSLLSVINILDQRSVTRHMVNYIYEQVVTILQDGARAFVPTRSKEFYKFWWNENLQLLKEESIASNRLWKAAGKPHNGKIFEDRQNCRREYRKLLRVSENNALRVYTNDLHEALLRKNGPAFWKVWRSKFQNPEKCMDVDGLVSEPAIA